MEKQRVLQAMPAHSHEYMSVVCETEASSLIRGVNLKHIYFYLVSPTT